MNVTDSVQKLILVIVVSLMLNVFVFAEGKISGVIFGDYYYVAKNHNEKVEGRNGFWIRRVYFTYENLVGETIKIRFRMEFNQNGDFITKGKITPYIKDAFFQWAPSKNNLLIAGISDPPAYEVIEKIWGYRELEKTPLDLQKIRDSRDFGLSWKGEKKNLSYHLFFGNGSGNDTEIDKGKAFYTAVGYNLSHNLFFQIYADYDYKEKNKYSYIWQVFVARKSKSFRVGAHYSHCVFKNDSSRYDNDIASIFSVIKLKEKSDLILRFDAVLDPNPKGSSIAYVPFNSTASFNMVIAGISYIPNKSIKLIPNIKYVFYDSETAEKVNSDMYINLTFVYLF